MPAYSVKGKELDRVLKKITEKRIDVVRKVSSGYISPHGECPLFCVTEGGVPKCEGDPRSIMMRSCGGMNYLEGWVCDIYRELVKKKEEKDL